VTTVDAGMLAALCLGVGGWVGYRLAVCLSWSDVRDLQRLDW